MTPLEEVLQKYHPVATYALFSGGNDSLASTHFAMNRFDACAVVHIRTGIGAKAATDFVVETCRLFGWPLRVMDPPDWSYRDMVLKRGFPGPGAHRYAYSWLKERAIAQLVRETKTQRKDRVMLVTGVRQQESARRMGYVVPVIRVGARIWFAPLFSYSKIGIHDYLKHNELKSNPLTALIGMSGECFCGAFAQPDEIKKIERHCPEVAEQIHALEVEARALGKHCVWGTRPPKAKDPNQYDMPFMPLCAGCSYKPSYLQG
jgi:3'-phosphoadenosine 5'-phosphosulfate sulfotransferase (PAPS reductase)/FAD synthetase